MPGGGWRVAMLIEGLDIEVVGLDGSPLRRLVLDPTTDYQRLPGRECPGLQCRLFGFWRGPASHRTTIEPRTRQFGLPA
jgi:hypothetical protein